MKPKRTTNQSLEVTISGFAAESGIDRRTVQRHIVAANLKPVFEDGSGRFYSRDAIYAALADYLASYESVTERAARKKGLTPRQNLIRMTAEKAVEAAFEAVGGLTAKHLFDVLVKNGMPEETAKCYAIETWLFQAGQTALFIIDDDFDSVLKTQMQVGLDDFWAKCGFHDQSAPPQSVKIPVPPGVQQWARENGKPLADTLDIS